MKEDATSSSEAAYVPVNVMDNESNVKLKDPSVQGFSNGSKNINDINVADSPNVGELYGRV
ncbi:MAG: hypothetical protein LBJ31_11215 [Treponema sp.]|nr:hypothetical protein [Treponema sp.]